MEDGHMEIGRKMWERHEQGEKVKVRREWKRKEGYLEEKIRKTAWE